MSAVELRGGTHFLLLHRLPNGSGHEVESVPRFDDVVSHWRDGSRVSPLFALNGSPVPPIPKEGRAWVVFMGPMFPGDFNSSVLPHAYLSLGLLNVVCVATTNSERTAALALAQKLNVHWEEWGIVRHKLKRTRSSRYNPEKPTFRKNFSDPLPKMLPLMKATEREYLLLFKASYAYARRFLPDLAEELADFNDIVRGTLADTEVDVGYKHGLLVNANAYLSRQTEQTYAGTPPIVEHDTHLWPHSLLGVGVGSLALVRVRQFVGRAFANARLIGRLKSLAEVPVSGKHLPFLLHSDKFWQRDHLGDRSPTDPDKASTALAADEPAMPHITCFSGRDGFRSTSLSLSAPQELLTSCNTSTWTLLTLTHEISHIIVSGVLGVVVPPPNRLEELIKVVQWVKAKDEKSLLDQIRSFLAFAIWQLDPEEGDKELTPELLGELIESNWRELNEILTHCFDFLYFYRKEPLHYVGSVWTSWEVIPNIRERIPDYLTRTLCALHTTNLDRKDGINTSIDQLITVLTSVNARLKEANYVSRALEMLQTHRDDYRNALAKREQLVRFVRSFLYSQDVEKVLAKEGLLGPDRDNKGYPMAPLQFGIDRIKNPLRFIEAFACDVDPIPLRSVWILQHLAFGGGV
jgi:hypothetical protein